MSYVGLPNDGNPNAYLAGNAIGPYNFRRNPGNLLFNAFCIDFDNLVNNGQTWNARVVSINSLGSSQADFNAFVRVLGTAATAGTLPGTYSAAAADEWMKRLRASAYLTGLMSGAPTTSWDETHFAMWSLFSTATPNPSDPAAAATLRSQALAAATASPNGYGDYVVLLDARAYDQGYSGSFVQAYITNSSTVVPEPSTYVLMITGLAGVGLLARRRRSTAP